MCKAQQQAGCPYGSVQHGASLGIRGSKQSSWQWLARSPPPHSRHAPGVGRRLEGNEPLPPAFVQKLLGPPHMGRLGALSHAAAAMVWSQKVLSGRVQASKPAILLCKGIPVEVCRGEHGSSPLVEAAAPAPPIQPAPFEEWQPSAAGHPPGYGESRARMAADQLARLKRSEGAPL